MAPFDYGTQGHLKARLFIRAKPKVIKYSLLIFSTNKSLLEWIGSISCKNDIIIAGSGLGHIYTYHAGSQTLLQTYKANAPVLAIEQENYDIISAGRESFISSWNSDGSSKVFRFSSRPADILIYFSVTYQHSRRIDLQFETESKSEQPSKNGVFRI